MTSVQVVGAGAFGTALAIALHRGGKEVTLVGRSVAGWQDGRKNPRLPDILVPPEIALQSKITADLETILLLAIPTQRLSEFLSENRPRAAVAVACCKGIEVSSGLGPTALMAAHLDCPTAVLTGPSFAIDIARGLPTALTLATKMKDPAPLQQLLSTDALRLYLSDDPIGAELGGALKNVIAIACGICIGAGLGDSARAALMTRGFAEMQRLALALGARSDTLMGLSGFGDLALTCTSRLSRNFSYGIALGEKSDLPEGQTIEGRATAQAVVDLARTHGIDMPIAQTVRSMVEETTSLEQALSDLLSRPLTKE